MANERHRVLRGDADNDMLKIENLTKVGAASGCKEIPGTTPAQGCGWGSGSWWAESAFPFPTRCTSPARLGASWLWTGCVWVCVPGNALGCWASMVRARPQHSRC